MDHSKRSTNALLVELFQRSEWMLNYFRIDNESARRIGERLIRDAGVIAHTEQYIRYIETAWEQERDVLARGKPAAIAYSEGKEQEIALARHGDQKPGGETSHIPTPADGNESKSSVLVAWDKGWTSQGSRSADRESALNNPLPIRSTDKRVAFRLEKNAMLGSLYEARLLSSPPDVEILEVTPIEAIGNLKYDRDRQLVVGTLQKEGSYRLTIRYQTRASSFVNETHCLLNVIPDPELMWKEAEPDPSSPYPKDHQATFEKRLQDDTMIVAASKRGRSHAHNGKFRDDDFAINFDSQSGWSVLTVADGAGSASMSRRGSQIATSLCTQKILNGLSSTDRMQFLPQDTGSTEKITPAARSIVDQLFRSAVLDAAQAIELEAKTSNLPAREFATTLLTCAYCSINRRVVAITFAIGDGAIGVYSKTRGTTLMTRPDSGAYAGETRFLERRHLEGAQEVSKRICVESLPTNDFTAVILMTDGVCDPKFPTEQALDDRSRWDSLWNSLDPVFQQSNVGDALLKWLDFYEKGHHDDRTIAVLGRLRTA